MNSFTFELSYFERIRVSMLHLSFHSLFCTVILQKNLGIYTPFLHLCGMPTGTRAPPPFDQKFYYTLHFAHSLKMKYYAIERKNTCFPDLKRPSFSPLWKCFRKINHAFPPKYRPFPNPLPFLVTPLLKDSKIHKVLEVFPLKNI